MQGTRHLTEGQKVAALAAYRQTPSVTMVARALGVSVRQIRHMLRREGVALSRAHDGACYRNIDLIRRLASEGASLSEIARQVGTTRKIVALFLDLHQIPRTPFLQVGANNPAWKGGRIVDKDGYLLILTPEHPHADRHGYVREHRLVMEKQIGRYLLPTEVVDHIDGNRGNNDSGNLRLFASNKEHLAATLNGRTPKWTPEGRERQRAAFDRGLGRRNAASRPASGSDAAP